MRHTINILKTIMVYMLIHKAILRGLGSRWLHLSDTFELNGTVPQDLDEQQLRAAHSRGASRAVSGLVHADFDISLHPLSLCLTAGVGAPAAAGHQQQCHCHPAHEPNQQLFRPADTLIYVISKI